MSVYGLPGPPRSLYKELIRGTPGLDRYYPLDERAGSTTARDYGPNNATATLSGNGYFGVTGLPMGGTAFGVSAQYSLMYLAASGCLTGSITEVAFEAWVRVPDPRGFWSVMREQGGGGYWVFGWHGGYDAQFIQSSDLGTGGPAMGIATDGEFHHYAVTWKQNTTNGFKTYRDGQLVTQRNAANVTYPNPGATLGIGAWAGQGEGSTGAIAHCAIYQRALSSAEILLRYQVGQGR